MLKFSLCISWNNLKPPAKVIFEMRNNVVHKRIISETISLCVYHFIKFEEKKASKQADGMTWTKNGLKNYVNSEWEWFNVLKEFLRPQNWFVNIFCLIHEYTVSFSNQIYIKFHILINRCNIIVIQLFKKMSRSNHVKS